MIARLDPFFSTDGSVKDVKVIADKPNGMFGESAIKAIQQWRFKPAFMDGQAIEQRAVQLMEFRLK